MFLLIKKQNIRFLIQDHYLKLIDYLKDNKIDNSGVHLQLGLRFKILVIDSHLNFRYNMTKDVYEGENGFTEIQFKLGMGF